MRPGFTATNQEKPAEVNGRGRKSDFDTGVAELPFSKTDQALLRQSQRVLMPCAYSRHITRRRGS